MSGQRRRPTTYAPNPEGIQAANEAAARSIQFAKNTQRANEKGSRDTAAEAVGRAVPAYALPTGGSKKGMSTADQANVARSVRAYEAGGHMAPNTPQMRTAAPAASGTRPAFGGSTPEEVSDFYKGAPNPTKDVAGTGQQVLTPYGFAGSTTDKSSPARLAERPATPTYDEKGKQVGVGRASPALNWQEQLVAKHPEIGVKDSPENKAFVAQYKQAQAAKELNQDGSPKDHFGMAESAIASTKPPSMGGSGAGATGVDAPAAMVPTEQQQGQAIRSAPSVAQAAGTGLAAAVTGTVANAAGKAADFQAGLTGQDPGKVRQQYADLYHKHVGSMFDVNKLPPLGQPGVHSSTAASGGVNPASSASGTVAYSPPISIPPPETPPMTAADLYSAGAPQKPYTPIGEPPPPARTSISDYPIGKPPIPPQTSADMYAAQGPTLPTAPRPPAPAMAFPPAQKPDDRKSDTANF